MCRRLAPTYTQIYPFSTDTYKVSYQSVKTMERPTIHSCVYVCMYRIVTGDQWESVFLLAGDDLAMHLYRESLLSEVRPSFSLLSSTIDN